MAISIRSLFEIKKETEEKNSKKKKLRGSLSSRRGRFKTR